MSSNFVNFHSKLRAFLCTWHLHQVYVIILFLLKLEHRLQMLVESLTDKRYKGPYFQSSFILLHV